VSQDSLKKRYLTKLSSRGIQFLLSFLTIGIVPRALGPADYGNFAFLSNFFKRLFQLIDFNVSTAFFTKFSKRQSEKKLLGFRLYHFAISIFVLVLISLLIVMSEYKELILPGQNRIIIYAVLIYMSLNLFSLFKKKENNIEIVKKML